MSEYVIVVVLALIAIGAVAFPLLVGHDRFGSRAELDAEVARYREALQAGTVCGRCRQANDPESRFCAECGRELS